MFHKLLSRFMIFRSKTQKGVAGIWEEEEIFLKAVESLYKEEKLKPIAITPYPVHGLEELTHTPRSWIPWVAFVGGLSGCLFGLWFTWWTSAVDWPILVGGKPFWSLPAFIPIIFELTILFSALSSIGALLYACGIPRLSVPIIDKDLTCHKFALFICEKDISKESAQILFKKLKANTVKETEF